MAPEGYAALSERVAALEDDVLEVKEDVKSIKADMKTVLAFISEENGARKERDKTQMQRDRDTAAFRTQSNFQAEMTWTKVMAMAGMIGAITGLIALAPHFVFHVY